MARGNRFERLERYIELLIQRKRPEKDFRGGVRVLLVALRYLSYLYSGIVQLRLFLYEKGILRHHALGCQVISVGNLTVGGTGKTPVVEVFARELQKAGRRVAILSRGYKKLEPTVWELIADKITRRGKWTLPRVVSDGNTLLLDSLMSGDEPYMLASNLPDVLVLVDKNRVRSGRHAISKYGCDTLILDDGFQYLALKHRVEIVLVDRTNPFGNEFVLPRGILREPIRNISRADFIFITKSDGVGSEELKAKLRELNPRAEMIECKHCPRYLQNLYSSERRELGWLQGLRVVVVSGIAAPASFESAIESRGAVILDRHRFADHHRYTQQEVIDIVNASKRLGASAIVTTEKDAVRFPRLERCDVPVYFLRVDIEILSGAEDFRTCLSRICFR